MDQFISTENKFYNIYILKTWDRYIKDWFVVIKF